MQALFQHDVRRGLRCAGDAEPGCGLPGLVCTVQPSLGVLGGYRSHLAVERLELTQVIVVS